MTHKEIVKKTKESTILFVKMFLDRRRFRRLDEFTIGPSAMASYFD